MLKPLHYNLGAPAKGVNTVPISLLLVVVWLSEARFASRRRVPAQGLVEYALIVTFVAIVVIAIVTIVGQTTCNTWWLKLVNNTAWGSNPTTSCPS